MEGINVTESYSYDFVGNRKTGPMSHINYEYDLANEIRRFSHGKSNPGPTPTLTEALTANIIPVVAPV